MTTKLEPVGGGHSVCPSLPHVIGHRGAAARAPENTLAGLRRARALGCDWVEFDIRLAADGALVLCHDPRLDRTTNGRGRVAAQNLAAVRRYDAGSWFAPEFAGECVPTLDEALLFAADLGLGVNIEIKADSGYAAATAAATAVVLESIGTRAPPLLVSSFLAAALAAMRDVAPQVPRGLLVRAVPRRWREIAARLGCVTINADHRRLDPRRVAEIRAAGYPVLAYTVNDPVRARTLFGWGVASVFSDVPDIILPVGAAEPTGLKAAATGAFVELQRGAMR